MIEWKQGENSCFEYNDNFVSSPAYTENGQVVYIPINMADGTRITKHR